MLISNHKRNRGLLPGLLAAFALLAGCGGGSSDEAAAQPDQPLAVSYQIQPAVKQLTSAEQAQVDSSRSDYVELAQGLALKAGDVVITSTDTFKLGDPLPTTNVGMVRYARVQPAMPEVFSSLVLDGSYTGFSGVTQAAATAGGREGKQGVEIKRCDLGRSVAGLAGGGCDYQVEVDGAALVIEGQTGIGFEMKFKAMDLVLRKGTGSMAAAIDSKLELKVSAASQGLADSGRKACSVSGALGPLQRRLGSFTIPTQLPGLTIQVPVCVFLEGESVVSGTLYSLEASQRFDVQFNEGSGTVTAGPTGNGPTELGKPSSVWSMAPLKAGATAFQPVEGAASITGGVQVSAEIAFLKRGWTGAQMELTASVNGQAKYAPAKIKEPKSVAAILDSRFYCIQAAASADLALSAFAAVPAWFWQDKEDPAAAGVARLAAVNLWKGDLRSIGNCDFKVKTAVDITVVPAQPSRDKLFKVVVRRDDAEADLLWGDRAPVGDVTLTDPDGAVICTAAIVDGKGECSHRYAAPPRTDHVIGAFVGDQIHYADSAPTGQVAVQVGVDGVSWTATRTEDDGCDEDGVTTVGGAGAAVAGRPGIYTTTLEGGTQAEFSVPGSTSVTFSYPDGEGTTTETVTASFGPFDELRGFGPFSAGGGYTWVGTNGGTCSATYSMSGTYTY